SDDDERLRTLNAFVVCPDCGGARLNREARAVRFAEKALHEITALSVEQAAAFFGEPSPVRGRLPSPLLAEIAQRLHFLEQVGLGYLTLDRPAQSLSGGEAQRARLAT